MARVLVAWGGATHDLGVHVGPLTAADVAQRIGALCCVHLVEDAKLIVHGRRIEALDTTSGGGDLHVTLVAATVSEVAAVQEAAAAAPRLRADLADDAPALTAAPRGIRTLRPQSSGFGSIVTLPGQPDEARARQILEAVASDRRVSAVMAARGWLVPELREMFPDGKVGVDPVCVLGLNVNAGQRIELRIRTDDMLGFRKMGVIMKVLWHELAHNLISEHSHAFFELVSTLEREGAAADWTTASAGHVLGGEAADPYAPFGRRGIVAPSIGRSGLITPQEDGHVAAVRPPATADVTEVAETHGRASPAPAPAPAPPQLAAPPPLSVPDDVAAAIKAADRRAGRMREALDVLSRDCRTASIDCKSALALLAGIIQRASASTQGHGEEESKRQVRPQNAAFVRGTAGSAGAVSFLRLCGFRDARHEDGQAWLQLPPRGSTDLGSLWLGQQVIEGEMGPLAPRP